MAEQLRFEIVVDDKGSPVLKSFAGNVGASTAAMGGMKSAATSAAASFAAVGAATTITTKKIADNAKGFQNIIGDVLAWKRAGIGVEGILRQISGSSSGAAEGAGKLAVALKGVGVAVGIFVAGMTTWIMGMKKLTQAAAEAEEVTNRLSFRFKALGYGIKGDIPEIDAWAASIQRSTRFSDEAAKTGLTQMLMYTDELSVAQKNLQLAMDMSTTTGESLESSVRKIGQVYEGNIESLGRMIPEMRNWKAVLGENATQAQKTAYAFELLNQKFGGAAQADVGTTRGLWDQLKNSLDDLWESVGGGIATRAWQNWLLGAKSIIDSTNEMIKGFDREKASIADLGREQERLLKAREAETDRLAKTAATPWGKIVGISPTESAATKEIDKQLQLNAAMERRRILEMEGVKKREEALRIARLEEIANKDLEEVLRKIAENQKIILTAANQSYDAKLAELKVTQSIELEEAKKYAASKKYADLLKSINEKYHQLGLNILREERIQQVGIRNTLLQSEGEYAKIMNNLTEEFRVLKDQNTLKNKLLDIDVQRGILSEKEAESQKYMNDLLTNEAIKRMKIEEEIKQLGISDTLLNLKGQYASITESLEDQQRILDMQLANKIKQLDLDVRRNVLTREQANAQITMMKAIRAEETRRLPFTTLGTTPMADQVKNVENQRAAVEKLNLAWLTGQVSVRDYAAALDTLTKTMTDITGGDLDKMYSDALNINKENLAAIDKMNIDAAERNKKRTEEARRFAEETQKISEIEKPDIIKKQELLKDLTRQYERIKETVSIPMTMNLDAVNARSTLDLMKETVRRIKMDVETPFKMSIDISDVDSKITKLIEKIRQLKKEMSEMKSNTSFTGTGSTQKPLSEKFDEFITKAGGLENAVNAIQANISFIGASADVTRAEAKLRMIEQYFPAIANAVQLTSAGWSIASGLPYWAQQTALAVMDLKTTIEQGRLQMGQSQLEMYSYSHGYQQGTNYVPRTGMYLLHQGEQVKPANNNVSFGNVSITVPKGSTKKQALALWSEFNRLAKYRQIGELKS